MQLFINFLLTTGIVIALIIITVLIRRGSALPQKLLTLIFLLLLFVVLYSYGEQNNLKWLYRTCYIIADAVGFLLGPLLYLYITSLYRQNQGLLPKRYLHFIPAIIYIVLVSIPFLVSSINDNYLFAYLPFIDQHLYLLQLQGIYLLVYVLFSLHLLRRIQSETKEHYSNLSKKSLKWISNLLYGLLIILLIHACLEVYAVIYHRQLSFDNIATTLMLIFVLIYLGYYGISQSEVFLPGNLQAKGSGSREEVAIAASHHLVNTPEREITQLKSALLRVLKKNKPYLDEDLNLKTLAEMVSTSDRKLSALLNHHLGTTFYDFVNSYRVEEVKRRMADKDNDRYTILSLAYASGFSSKSSFNRIFKKETGMSPSAFKKQLSEGPSPS